MKKYLLTLYICLFGAVSYAQQKPQFTQYINNQFLLNPAMAGIENYTDLKLGHRKQWQGIKDAPQTSFVSINAALGHEYFWANPLTQFYGLDGNPAANSYLQYYTASPAHHGIGATFFSDNAGPLTNTEASLSYAYHLQFSQTMNLSVGTSLGFSSMRLNLNKLDFGSIVNDPALAAINNKVTKPTVMVGTWLYGARFFAGLSVDQFISGQMIFSENNRVAVGSTKPNIFFTAGYKVAIDEEIAVLPSVMYKQLNGTMGTYDLNAKVLLRDQFWVGASYRKSDSFAGMAGFNIAKTVNLSYTYDYNISAINQMAKGSHEITIGVLLNNVYDVPSFMRW